LTPPPPPPPPAPPPPPGRYVALLYRQPEPYSGGRAERALDSDRGKFDLNGLGLGLPAGVRYFVSQR
jgi:hypothetical protein